jgi:hypothetical protein
MACAITFFPPAFAHVMLHQSDFENGTYLIKKSGTYRLAEDISFNPHPPGSLADDGTVLDAYTAGRPLPSQLGDPAAGKYDPAAFGIGFFAAIAITANNVELDLNGYTIEQSAEHTLLQRFFAVIELADQPFLPRQGPADFGAEIKSAKNVIIKNGTIGRSSHHGIHGNNNANIVIRNVYFEDYEVAAVALNGVKNLKIVNCNAWNREDVPVLGTFSNARFISAYVDWLVTTGSTTTLKVGGVNLTATQIRDELRTSINNVHEDVILDKLGVIDAAEHPHEYALYHNKHGVIDGNSYGFLLNQSGVAVDGFATLPDNPAQNVVLKNVHILNQKAFVNEIVAIKQNGKAVIDPVGAVFMLKNVHPDSGDPLTVSSNDDSAAVYTGNVLANAQALVAKANLNGEFPTFLDTTRLNITQAVIDWIETENTLDTLVLSPQDYICNGDTMFHVNKGVIGFKIDGTKGAVLKHTSARNLENLGEAGVALCGSYTKSHPKATLEGYGGAAVRGYTFAGSKRIRVVDAAAINLMSLNGTVTGFSVLTDSRNILIKDSVIEGMKAGLFFVTNGGPNEVPQAIGVHIGTDATRVRLKWIDIAELQAYDEAISIKDDSGAAKF